MSVEVRLDASIYAAEKLGCGATRWMRRIVRIEGSTGLNGFGSF
jgi:hypothetical protein